MNDKDKEEFDKWFLEAYRYDYHKLVIPESVNPQKEAWQAAIAHERKRREGLVELALFIMKDNEWHNDEGSIEYQVYKILEKAIEEL